VRYNMELDLTQITSYFVDLSATGLLVSFVMKTLTANFAVLAGAHRFLKLAFVVLLGVVTTFVGSFLGYVTGDFKYLVTYGVLAGLTGAGLYDTALRPFTDFLVRLLQQVALKK